MIENFQHIAVLGGGLLGGSLALQLQQQNREVRLWSRREETTQLAKNLGLIHASSDLSEVVADADLVVLCVPVGAMLALVEQAVAAGMPKSALVTDVGSVKGMVHQTLEAPLAEQGILFLGSHPMAGSERKGLEAAKVDLFQHAACLLTAGRGAAREKFGDRLENFWASVGCRVSWIEAEMHDQLVARISHVPHAIAAAGALVCLQNVADGAFSGGGLRDTTRVAGGDAAMWTEIFLENRAAIGEPLREVIEQLQCLQLALARGEQDVVRAWLETAKRQREQFLNLF